MVDQRKRVVDFGAHIWISYADVPGFVPKMYLVTQYSRQKGNVLGPQDELTRSLLGASEGEVREYFDPADNRRFLVKVCRVTPGKDIPQTTLKPYRLRHKREALETISRLERIANDEMGRHNWQAVMEVGIQLLDEMASIRDMVDTSVYPKVLRSAHDLCGLIFGGYLAHEDMLGARQWLGQVAELGRDIRPLAKDLATILDDLTPILKERPFHGTPRDRSAYYVALGKAIQEKFDTKDSHNPFVNIVSLYFCQKALEERFENPAAHVALAAACRRQASYRRAIDECRIGLGLAQCQDDRESTLYAMTTLGAALVDIEEYSEAEAVLVDALRLTPPDRWDREAAGAFEGKKKAAVNVLCRCYRWWLSSDGVSSRFMDLPASRRREVGEGLLSLGTKQVKAGRLTEAEAISRSLQALGLQTMAARLLAVMGRL